MQTDPNVERAAAWIFWSHPRLDFPASTADPPRGAEGDSAGSAAA